MIKDFEVVRRRGSANVQIVKGLYKSTLIQKSRRVLFLTHVSMRTVMAMRITMVDLTHFFCVTL